MSSAYLFATEERTFHYPVPGEVKSRKGPCDVVTHCKNRRSNLPDGVILSGAASQAERRTLRVPITPSWPFVSLLVRQLP